MTCEEARTYLVQRPHDLTDAVVAATCIHVTKCEACQEWRKTNPGPVARTDEERRGVSTRVDKLVQDPEIAAECQKPDVIEAATRYMEKRNAPRSR
jgi:hypothetical protein